MSARLLATPASQVYLSAIAAEEIITGVLSAINTERSKPKLGLDVAYVRMEQVIKHLAAFQFLPYNDQANRLFKSWRTGIVRGREYDCRTAALAIVSGMAVVTSDKDYAGIPGVQVIDWSR